MFDYLRNFPIDIELLPQRLRELLSPVGMQPGFSVEVCCSFEQDRGGAAYESLLMQMALVEDADDQAPPHLHSEEGVVAHSIPTVRERGSESEFSPDIDGHDYIVAAWGGGSFFSYIPVLLSSLPRDGTGSLQLPRRSSSQVAQGLVRFLHQ